MPFGHANTVLLSHESSDRITSNLNSKHMVTLFTLSYPHIFLGYVVAQVQVIFQPITNPISPPLLYVKFFNFLSAHFAVVNDICVVVPVPNLEMLLVCHQL